MIDTSHIRNLEHILMARIDKLSNELVELVSQRARVQFPLSSGNFFSFDRCGCTLKVTPQTLSSSC